MHIFIILFTLTLYQTYEVHMSKSIEEKIKEVRNYSNLTEGWDGEHSVGPLASHVEQAVNVLNFWPGNLPLPIPMINYEGKIGFYVDTLEYYMDLEIEQENTLSLYIRSRSDKTKENYKDGIMLNESLGKVINEYVQDINTNYHLFKDDNHVKNNTII